MYAASIQAPTSSEPTGIGTQSFFFRFAVYFTSNAHNQKVASRPQTLTRQEHLSVIRSGPVPFSLVSPTPLPQPDQTKKIMPENPILTLRNKALSTANALHESFETALGMSKDPSKKPDHQDNRDGKDQRQRRGQQQ